MSLRPPAARPVFPGRGGRGRAGVVMAGLAVRESVTLAGRAERARAARAFVGAVLGRGHPCKDVAVLLVSEIFGISVRHSGSGAPGGDGHGRGQSRGRRRPGRGHRPRRAGDAGAAFCGLLCGRRPGAPTRCGPRGAVGLATARRAAGDLVRTVAPLLMSPPGDWAQIYIASIPCPGRLRGPEPPHLSCRGCGGRDGGIGRVGIAIRLRWGCPP